MIDTPENNASSPTSEEQGELKSVAAYISTLPPREEWVDICQLIPPQIAVTIHKTWEWLGVSLDAFFSDEPNPLPNSGLDEALQQVIERKSSKYRILSSLFFEAEHLIRAEARQFKITPSFDQRFPRRSDLIKVWALEECRHGVLIWLQEFWESHSQKQISERLANIDRYHRGELSKEEFTTLQAKWEEEDRKLQRNIPDISSIRPWSYFFAGVFEVYADKLPSFNAFAAIETTVDDDFKKFFVVNREYQGYPSRGKDRQKRKTEKQIQKQKKLKDRLTKP
jgi:hypothetical protein